MDRAEGASAVDSHRSVRQAAAAWTTGVTSRDKERRRQTSEATPRCLSAARSGSHCAASTETKCRASHAHVRPAWRAADRLAHVARHDHEVQVPRVERLARRLPRAAAPHVLGDLLGGSSGEPG